MPLPKGAASGIAGLRLRSRGRNEEVADETVLAQSNRECDESCRHRPIRLPVDEVEEHRSQVTKALRSERIVRRHFCADIDIGIKAHAPKSAQWKKWYEKITIQNLLDHKAGFTRSGDEEGAAEMFHVSEEDLTYAQVHRHFLRTRELLQEPGTESEY